MVDQSTCKIKLLLLIKWQLRKTSFESKNLLFKADGEICKGQKDSKVLDLLLKKPLYSQFSSKKCLLFQDPNESFPFIF